LRRLRFIFILAALALALLPASARAGTSSNDGVGLTWPGYVDTDLPEFRS
jgi:hypothetical protein